MRTLGLFVLASSLCLAGPGCGGGGDGGTFLLVTVERGAAVGAVHAVDLTLVGRYYERCADHAVSVARRVTFLVTGDYDTVVDREDEEDAVLSS